MRNNYPQDSIHHNNVIQTISAEVQATQQWLDEIIIGLNFCPFAKKEFVNNTIFYYKSDEEQLKPALDMLLEQCQYLEQNKEVETTLIIYSKGFKNFERYLDLIDYANDLLIDSGFEGVFQIATMHPKYCFADVNFDDVSNFTNRSPYPILHIIREDSISEVLSIYKNPESIPENNMDLADEKGSRFFQAILANIHQSHPQK